MKPAVSDGKIRGMWPGGPKGGDATWVRDRPPQLQRVSEIEERVAARSLRRTRRARARRLSWAWGACCLLALGVGAVLGLRSRTTPAELSAARAAKEERSLDISSEINRTLLELWKMEDLEFTRNRR